MKMLELVGVSKTYSEKTSPVHAVKSVSLSISPNNSYAIMGTSGSGKTTLLNILGLLDRPTAGNFLWDGNDMAKMSESKRDRLRNTQIGIVLQDFGLIEDATALENCMINQIIRGGSSSKAKSRAHEVLSQIGVGDLSNKKVKQLSGGQRQRVGIARSIMNKPALLLADEPTGSLDSQTTESILQTLMELHRYGMALIVVTHDINVAKRMSHILYMNDGRISPLPTHSSKTLTDTNNSEEQ